MTGESVWTIAKWVLLVVAAGFIGQFGKSLALSLIERRRRRKADSASGISDARINQDAVQAHEKAQAKIEKKRAKAAVKQNKKS